MMASPPPKQIRVRMAPSPTGFLHIGTARTTLFNWLFARHTGGTFVLRIEDTDAERSKPEHETSLIEALRWLGLEWDEGPDVGGPYGPYRQSERGDHYKKYLEALLSSGNAYYCYCTKEDLEAQQESLKAAGLPPKYSGHCRSVTTAPEGRAGIIRLKVPEHTVVFHDLIRGTIKFDASLLGDIVIARTMESALYHFAVVVDDHEMKITHVIRGEDHIANTPKHILIQQALGFPEPIYAHVPLVLAPDRTKLSKRNNLSSFSSYQEKGYLPEAMMNFLALLGWHPKGDKEILIEEEIVQEFSIERIQKAGAIFNLEKLDWINAQYIKQLSVDDLAERLTPLLGAKEIFPDPLFLKKVIVVERDRLKVLGEFVENAKFFFVLEPYDATLIKWKDDAPAQAKLVLEGIAEVLKDLPEIFAKETLLTGLDPLIKTYSRGSVLWPLRVALSGKKASPDPLVIAEILGRDETMRRVHGAVQLLSS